MGRDAADTVRMAGWDDTAWHHEVDRSMVDNRSLDDQGRGDLTCR